MREVHQQLEQLGVGVFIRDRAWQSRLTEAEFWRAYEEPIIVWVRSDDFDDTSVESLIPLLRKFPHIRELRFGGTRVTASGVEKLLVEWPDVKIEGVQRPNQAMQRTAGRSAF
ncbi:MAG: hypothetical protein QOH88_2396 [Verrucomicrobiota bacterium]|jgi:hypothetical protein